jgi:putative transposase
MLHTIDLFLASIVRLFRSRQDLLLENLALRQQLAVLKRKHPRPRLKLFDKLFWVLAQKFWHGWKRVLILVSPETVVRWHGAGFRLYWAWLSRHQISFGRKRISKELRELIFKMVAENPTWSASRIHGELQMLGFDVSERTVSRWVQRAPRDSEKIPRWKTLLKNHREVIAAMDFFTVHTVTFSLLYCFFLVGHDRRRILHFNVTRNPESN